MAAIGYSLRGRNKCTISKRVGHKPTSRARLQIQTRGVTQVFIARVDGGRGAGSGWVIGGVGVVGPLVVVVVVLWWL